METINVVIVRTQSNSDGMGGHLTKEEPIAGSPFACCLYRRRPSYKRDESDPGTTTLDEQRILSVDNPDAGWLVNDVAVIPACAQTLGVETRIRIQHIRPYPNGLQADLESGAVKSKADANTTNLRGQIAD